MPFFCQRLEPAFTALSSCSSFLRGSINCCQGPDCFGGMLWENQIAGFVELFTLHAHARTQPLLLLSRMCTQTHATRIFMRPVNLCLCVDGNHRKQEIYSWGHVRSQSWGVSTVLVITVFHKYEIWLIFTYVYCVKYSFLFLQISFTLRLKHSLFKYDTFTLSAILNEWSKQEKNV